MVGCSQSASSSSLSVSPLQSSSSQDDISVSSDYSTSSVSFRKEFAIPDKWKPSIMVAIAEKKLNPEVRNEIVRDLVTHTYGHVEKPNIALVTKIAKLLVEKYPFMADVCDSVNDPRSTSYVRLLSFPIMLTIVWVCLGILG